MRPSNPKMWGTHPLDSLIAPTPRYRLGRYPELGYIDPSCHWFLRGVVFTRRPLVHKVAVCHQPPSVLAFRHHPPPAHLLKGLIRACGGMLCWDTTRRGVVLLVCIIVGQGLSFLGPGRSPGVWILEQTGGGGWGKRDCRTGSSQGPTVNNNAQLHIVRT